MKTSHIVRLVALALCLVSAPRALASDEAYVPPKNTFKKDAAAIWNEHKVDVRKTRVWLRKALKAVRADLASGEVRPADASSELGAISSKWHERLRDATSSALGDLETVATDRIVASGALSSARDAQLGTGGALDRVLARIDKAHAAALRDARTRFGVLARRVRDVHGHGVSVSLAEIARGDVVPNLGGGPAPRPSPTLDRVIGDGGEPVDGDGLLKIAGWTPDDTLDLTVRLERAGHVIDAISVGDIDPSGAWYVAVPELNGGNWRVSLLWNDVPVATLVAAVAD